jgi:hypothetical protein
MSTNKRVERPLQVIKSRITPISVTTKEKAKLAFQDVINRIKVKHLS